VGRRTPGPPQGGAASPIPGLAAAFLGGLLVFWPGQDVAYGLPKLTLLAGGLAWAWRGVAGRARTELDGALAGCLAVAALSAFFAADPGLSLLGSRLQPYYGLLQLALYACAFWLGASLDAASAATGGSLWVWGAGAMGAFAVLQAAGVVPAPWDQMHGRALSTAGNPAFAGACLAAALPLCASRALSRRGGYILAAVLAAAGLALTLTRGAWLAAALGLAVYAWLSGRLASRERRLALAACAVALLLAVGGLWWKRNRMAGPKASRADLVRLELWRCSLAAVRERPLLGYGPDGTSLALRRHKTEDFLAAAQHSGALEASAHNDLIQAAATTGLAGLAAYVFLWARLALALWRRREGPDREAFAAGVGSLAACFAVLKLNTVPAEALAPAAWLAGTLLGAKEGERASPLPPRWVCAFLAAAFAALCAADRSAFQAQALRRAGRLEEAAGRALRAAMLAPLTLEHSALASETTLELASRTPGPRGRELALETVARARKAAELHPGNPQSHELLGAALLAVGSSADKTLLPEALKELERASALDPLHPFPAERRAEAARLLGDAAALERAEADLKRITDAKHRDYGEAGP
jgi:O-antigen ligase